MADTERRHHGNRHGRSEAARQAVLQAADDLLAEKGFAGVTMEGIAARAGVAKQTVYRWWSSKTAVLVDAFVEDLAEELTPPDHGALALDLPAYLGRLAHVLSATDTGAVFRALIAQAQHDPAFGADFRARYLDEQRRRDRLPLERAVARGELPAGLDVAAETDRLVGPLYYRVLVTDEPVGRAYTDRLADDFLRRVASGIAGADAGGDVGLDAGEGVGGAVGSDAGEGVSRAVGLEAGEGAGGGVSGRAAPG